MADTYCPVVVGVDGSPESLGALRWAADIAVRRTRQLCVVHVADPAEAWTGGSDLAARAAAEAMRWLPGVAACPATETGAPLTVLRQFSFGAGLVVVGSRGRGRVRSALLGSVSEALSAEADCPVLVVPNAQRWAAADAELPRHGAITVGFDGSISADRALRLAFEEAADRGERLVVIHAWQHPDLWQEDGRGADLATVDAPVRDAALAAVEPWRAKFPDIRVEVRSQPGDPVAVLTQASQCSMLLVLGTRRIDDTIRPADSSVMNRVLRHAACPVLVAHGTSRRPWGAVAV